LRPLGRYRGRGRVAAPGSILGLARPSLRSPSRSPVWRLWSMYSRRSVDPGGCSGFRPTACSMPARLPSRDHPGLEVVFLDQVLVDGVSREREVSCLDELARMLLMSVSAARCCWVLVTSVVDRPVLAASASVSCSTVFSRVVSGRVLEYLGEAVVHVHFVLDDFAGLGVGQLPVSVVLEGCLWTGS